MATDPCLTPELDRDLRQLRLHWQTVERRRMELTSYIDSAIAEVRDTDWFKVIADSGERLELAGQVVDAATAPTIGNVLAACGKTISVIFGALSESSAQDKRTAAVRAKIASLTTELKAALDQFVLSKAQFEASFERYWACTEKHRPRKLAMDLTLQGSTTGGLASASFKRAWSLRAPLPSHVEPYDARLARWLADPRLEEQIVVDADVISTMPAYRWVASRPDVTVKAAKPTFSGGPLRAHVMVWWSRSDPTATRFSIGSTGEQSVNLSVTFTVKGVTNTIGGAQQLGPMLVTQLRLRKVLGVLARPDWLPSQRRWTYEHGSTAKGSQIVVVIT